MDTMTHEEYRVLKSYVEKYGVGDVLKHLSNAVRSIEAKKRLNEVIKEHNEEERERIAKLKEGVISDHMAGKSNVDIAIKYDVPESFVKKTIDRLIKGKE